MFENTDAEVGLVTMAPRPSGACPSLTGQPDPESPDRAGRSFAVEPQTSCGCAQGLYLEQRRWSDSIATSAGQSLPAVSITAMSQIALPGR